MNCTSLAPDEAQVAIRPERGMAVLHFPCTKPAAGGYTDRNASHESEAAEDTKWVCQQVVIMMFEPKSGKCNRVAPQSRPPGRELTRCSLASQFIWSHIPPGGFRMAGTEVPDRPLSRVAL
eukprot:4753959-Prymnesium_polylepis.1